MKIFVKKSAVEKEYEKILKAEEKYILKKQEKKESFLNRLVADKVPPKLQSTLEAAFAKAFLLLFTKGTGIIEKTYNGEKIRKNYKAKEAVNEIKQDRKSLKAFTKSSKSTGRKNLLISGTIGIGTGIIGVGLPDIPVFSSMLLKNIYETAMQYGFSYKGEKENYFVLKIIEGAVACGDEFASINEELNRFMETEQLPEEYSEEEEIKHAAKYLSGELLYTKFVQGIPVVGAAGGAYDAVYMKRVADYAVLKYRRRFIQQKRQNR